MNNLITGCFTFILFFLSISYDCVCVESHRCEVYFIYFIIWRKLIIILIINFFFKCTGINIIFICGNNGLLNNGINIIFLNLVLYFTSDPIRSFRVNFIICCHYNFFFLFFSLLFFNHQFFLLVHYFIYFAHYLLLYTKTEECKTLAITTLNDN